MIWLFFWLAYTWFIAKIVYINIINIKLNIIAILIFLYFLAIPIKSIFIPLLLRFYLRFHRTFYIFYFFFCI